MKNRLGFVIALVFAFALGTGAVFANNAGKAQTPSSQSSAANTAQMKKASYRRSNKRRRRHHRKARANKSGAQSGNSNTRG
ncbi:MAG TPA: hypothetical protein VM934_07090 [Pyrinomonadaceae bacterium]|nr:hypothetical protein [Pyrinomonadaceae bacterium]